MQHFSDRIPLLLTMLVFSFLPGKAQVLINEFLASNASVNADPDFSGYADWVELYNAGSTAADLNGWYLSDNENQPAKWAFPSGTAIPAGGFLLVWTDGRDTGLHASFKLSAAGEVIAIYNDAGGQADVAYFSEQLTDVSFGRQTDGGSPWGFFTHPTPGSSNGTSTFSADYVRQEPVFSVEGGFFETPVAVDVENFSGDGTLRFTLDGSAPSANSPVFTQTLILTATTVVKARIFYPDRIPGPVVTNTYFINENLEERGLAVLSLSTDPGYFFGADSGLYVQNFKPDWEYPVHMEFYEPDGILDFHHDAGVQIGGQNAWILPQKLLNIYSRKQYGKGHFEYQLFPDNPRTEFDDIILRCSGSDWSYTLFRDGLMQALIKKEADLDVQGFRPCIVFINGQYFGIHNIREKQDADYAQLHHNINPDSLDFIENDATVQEGNNVAYQQMVALLTAGVQSDAAFQNLEAIADTGDFTDYIQSQIFTANTSWGHNIALFRERSQAGRWRWLLHDYDRGFNLGNVNSTAMDWATATGGVSWSNPAWATLFLRKMLENEAFKQKFITRFADHLYITFNPVTIGRLVDRHANWIRAEMPNQVARWVGTTSSYGNAIPTVAFWENEVEKMKQFGQLRNAFLWTDLNAFFSQAGASQLDLLVSDPAHGFIRLHDLRVPSYPWTGKYFRNRPFTLTATARPGFDFDHWEKMDGQQLTLTGAGSAWKYSDATTAPPANWNQPAFNDGAWSTGLAQLGYGDGDEATVLSYGSNANNKTPAYYFRHAFDVPDPGALTSLVARLKVDDGAVVYLNGQEIWRINMPATPVIQFNDYALTTVGGSAEDAWNEQAIPASALVQGQNVLAVEVHQAAANSSDVSFDFELNGFSTTAAVVIGTDPVLELTLDDNPLTLRAVFEPDGTCGILPDTIFQNLTLTANCSPYLAAGDVVVKPGVSLSVEAGVEIHFPEKANLWVLGDLQVNGEENKPVLIKNAAGSGVWGGVFFKNATADSHLQYVIFKNASAGSHRVYFPAAISAYHSNLNLDHLDLTEVADNPVFSRFSDVVLTNSTLRSKVTGDCINVKQGFAQVENCTFEGGTQPDMDAIDYDGVTGGIIRNNVIHDFRGDNCDGLDIGEQSEDLLIEGNFIYHCLDKGISFGQQSSALVKNNTVAYTSIGIALKDRSLVTVDHCTFFGNLQGISAYEKNPGHLGGTGIMTDCIVSNAAVDAYVADAWSGLSVTNSLSDLDSLSSPGTLNADPKFANPTLYDFHLLAGSPANGTGAGGTNLGAVTLPVFEGEPQLMFSEILYDDTLTSTGEFVEIFNPGSKSVDLGGYSLAAAAAFVFPVGAMIEPGGYVVVAKTAGNFPGAPFPVFEWTSGRLKNEGEVIHLIDATGLLVDFVRYDNHAPWPEGSLLLGRSLELISGNPDNHFATSWQASEDPGGSPGAASWVVGTFSAEPQVQLTVFPNPATGWVNVAVKGAMTEALTLKLSDQSGRTVRRDDLGMGGGFRMKKMSLDRLPAGLYFLTVTDDQGRILKAEKVALLPK